MADGVAEDVLVVCPALNSQLKTWLSDEDGARDAAASRLRSTARRPDRRGCQRARGDR